jgi:fluoride exporter
MPPELLEPQERNLDEVAVPAPVYDSSERSVRRHDYLENERVADGPGQQRKDGDTKEELLEEEKSARIWYSSDFKRLIIIGHLIVFSLLGTLLRIAIESLTFYPGSPVNTSVLWANIGGSCIMGFLSEDQALWRFPEVDASLPEPDRDDLERRKAHYKSHSKTVPLFIGLTTGFCGSLTSFSTFIRDVFLALSNNLPVPYGEYSTVSLFSSAQVDAMAPNGGFSFMALVAVLLTEIGLSIAGLFVGAHIALAVSSRMPTVSQRLLLRVIDPFIMGLAVCSWTAVICLVVLLPAYAQQNTLWSPEVWRGPVLFDLVFAPAGCLARFYISLKLNDRFPWFPLGTFAVNISGTMILGMAYSLQHASMGGSTIGGLVGCQVLQGIMDGFCGCLTTVSTWVLELSGLRRRHAYLYGGLSVAVALGVLVVEIGSLKWTRGLTTPTCFAD